MVVLALQPLDLALQAVDLSLLAVVVDLGVALAPRQLCVESVELALQVLVRIAVPGLHAKVMPEFRNLYKSQKFGARPRHPLSGHHRASPALRCGNTFTESSDTYTWRPIADSASSMRFMLDARSGSRSRRT